MAQRPPRHRWTAEDDAGLTAAVETVGQIGSQASRYAISTWSAVAGRLLPDLIVTPSACRARWGWIREEARQRAEAQQQAAARDQETSATAEAQAEAAVAVDAWERAAGLVEQYEEDSEDRLLARIEGLASDVADVRAAVGRLEAMWR